MPLKRRDFLKIAGGVSLGLPLYQCAKEGLSNSVLESSWFSAVEHWTPTICQGCPGGCGILVRLIDDRAVKVEGNPIHPLNRGKVCPKGQAGLQLLYSPDRIKRPLKKIGGRESGTWQAISWEEALGIVATKLTLLRDSGKSHTVVFVGQDNRNTTDELIARFLEVYGTPNHIKLDEWTAIKKAHYLTQGIHDLLAPDLERSKYVLSFGADFLTNWANSMENQRVYGERRSKRDLKIVQIEPRFSLCASRADKWIPINPGTDGLLALGIASVIIKEKLYDVTFMNRFALHFQDFQDAVLSDVRLDSVSDLTGVPLRTIIEIAKEFATNKPAVAVMDYNLSFHSKGLPNALAIHSLNALVGNIDIPGGLLRQRRAPLREMPEMSLDEIAKGRLSQPRIDGVSDGKYPPRASNIKDFADNVMNRKPYEVNCLFLSNHNQLSSSPIFEKIKTAFPNIPFILSFASHMDEMSDFADIILPDTTYFEKWQENQISPLSKTPAVGIGQPVIKPRYESKPFEDIILSLAKRIIPQSSQNFPWETFKELLVYRLEGLFEAKKGSIFTSQYEEAQLRLLEERGWWVPQHATWSAFKQDLFEKGGWQDPSYHFKERSYIYKTPSRKFEFSSSLRSEEILPEFAGKESEYPFLLYLYDLSFTSENNGASMPWHQEALGFRFNLAWQTWVEVNPEKAEELSLKDKDLVWVESPYGKIRAVAKIFPGIMPHAVGIPLGKEEGIPGQKMTKKRDNPLILVGEAYDKETGVFSRQSTRVKIYKHE